MLGKLFSASRSRKVSFIAGLTIALASILGVSATTNRVFAGPDCEANSIIWCGFTSPTDFVNKVKANHSHAGGTSDHTDLQDIYRDTRLGGFDSSDYDRFIKTAQKGYAYRNGDIKLLDGTLVGTGAKSVGRDKGVHDPGTPNYFAWQIKNTAGKVVSTIYGNDLDHTYASGVTKIPVWVMFNGNGEAEFVVMDSCANAVIIKKIVPSYTCDALNATYDQNDSKKVTFTTNTTTKYANVAYVVYDFGNGVTKKVDTASNKFQTTYTYAQAGSYTAKVTVFVNVPGKNVKQIAPAGNCIKVINIGDYACVKLDGIILNQEDKTKIVVKFTVSGQGKGGATLTSADFKFGDPNIAGGGAQNGVKPDTANTVTVTYTYSNIDSTQDFEASASAVLHATSGAKTITAPACSTTVKATGVIPECKPKVPVGSPECLPPCTPGSSVPPESVECQPPELPNTGAGNTIAIFAAVVIGGFLVYRQLLFRRHHSAFVAAEQGTSPLPLADPLSDTPLEGTPLDKKSSTFRRKRLF